MINIPDVAFCRPYLLVQPGARRGPIALYRHGRRLHHFARFVDRESTKVTEFHHFRVTRSGFLEPIKIIDCDRACVGEIGYHVEIVSVLDSLPRSMRTNIAVAAKGLVMLTIRNGSLG